MLDGKVGHHISELISAKVVENGDDDDTGNKKIASIDLIDFDTTHLEMKINFEDPEAITKDMTFPDKLEI